MPLSNGKTPLLLNRLEAMGMQPVDDVFDDGVGCAGGRAETKRCNIVKIFGLKLLSVFDKTRVACRNARQFGQITAIGAVGRTDDEHGVACLGKMADGFLMLLHGRADMGMVVELRDPFGQSFRDGGDNLRVACRL